MKSLTEPLKFEMSSLIKKAQKIFKLSVDGITISLPFVSFSVKPDDSEKKVAREIVIRLADKRVLNSRECCLSCVKKALESIQNIRSILVDKQVDLSSHTEGILYLIIEVMLEGIRQFQTYEENLRSNYERFEEIEPFSLYTESLERLRTHLYLCLKQVSSVADVKLPKYSISNIKQNSWNVDVYDLPSGSISNVGVN